MLTVQLSCCSHCFPSSSAATAAFLLGFNVSTVSSGSSFFLDGFSLSASSFSASLISNGINACIGLLSLLGFIPLLLILTDAPLT